jgi:hypothetical protein
MSSSCLSDSNSVAHDAHWMNEFTQVSMLFVPWHGRTNDGIEIPQLSTLTERIGLSRHVRTDEFADR